MGRRTDARSTVIPARVSDNAYVRTRAAASHGKAVGRTGSKLTDSAIDAAMEHGEQLRKVQPRASSARYDRKLRRLVVEFTNGATFSFPPALAQGLSGATGDQLGDIRILGNGLGLHWEALDTDLSVPGLVDQVFGTRKFMARLAGQVKSPAKTAAARQNGAKGGRPRKPAHPS